MQLFLWLASARTELVIDERTAPVLLDIARRLEGWPLAILLAAARVDHMSLEQLRDRLGRGLDLLVGGGRDLPDRQRTLRGTIQWSLDLLGADAKRLLTWPEASIVAAELEALRRRSGSAWQELWDEGQRMPLDVAVRYGIASGLGKHLSAAAQQRAAAAP